MDLRHGFCSAWRRCSPAPPNVRTCTPASAVTPVQRRLGPRKRRVKHGLPANFVIAVDSIFQSEAPAAAVPLFIDELASQSSCNLDVVCPAVLQTRLSKAHSSAASAALVVQDTCDEKLVATASLDKGMAIWRFYSTQGEAESTDGSFEESIEVTRLRVPGAPVFSLAKIPEVLPDGTIVRKRPKPPGIYLGTASKEVLAWMLGSKDVTDKVVLDGHTGWVRSLAITGKWLFSCGCNYLRLWDTTFRTPKECDAVRLFTGDILSIAASDGRVFTAGADGSLRSWTITRAGDLQEGPSRERAHDGRVSACIIGGGRVFTVSYDGSIKAWNAETLELIAEVRDAHNGDKVFCVAMGSNGVVFSGGDDKLIRAWDQDLRSIGAALEGHNSAVRVLSAGRRALLVSGDAEGDVCIWETYPVELPSAARASSPFEIMTEPSVAMGLGQPTVVNGNGNGYSNGHGNGAVSTPEFLQMLTGTADMSTVSEVAMLQMESTAAPAESDMFNASVEAQEGLALPSQQQTHQQKGPGAVELHALSSPDVEQPLHQQEYKEHELFHQQWCGGPDSSSLSPISADQQHLTHQQQSTDGVVTMQMELEQRSADQHQGIQEQHQQLYAQEHEQQCYAVSASEPSAMWDICGPAADDHADADDAVYSSNGVCNCANIEHIEDGLERSHHGSADGHMGDDELQMVTAAAAVNANGSSRFAVLAAAVSGHPIEEPSLAVTAKEPSEAGEVVAAETTEEEEPEPLIRQIEVESVASAFAMTCLTKDPAASAPASTGGRAP